MLMRKSKKELFVPGSTHFALQLLQRLTNQEDNCCVSPYNLAVLLAMLYAGARGDTAAQMAEALGFPADHTELHPQMVDLKEQLLAGGREGQYELHTGNKIWTQSGFTLRQSFIDIMTAQYESGLGQVDFSQVGMTCQIINQWIEAQTGGLIKNLITPDLISPLTRVVLASAVYFKGKWMNPFPMDSTREEEFWLAPNRLIRIPMMYQEVETQYAQYADVQVLALPYHHLGRKAADVSMIILLPRRGTLDDVVVRLTAREVDRWADGLEYQLVKIFLPKFRIEFKAYLATFFIQLGIVNAFDPSKADFSGMAQVSDPFSIEQIVHKAYVNIDEEGTEAAAASATAIMLGSAGWIWDEQPVPVFRADHPFLFLIRHNPSGSILFVGRVNNPQAGHNKT